VDVHNDRTAAPVGGQFEVALTDGARVGRRDPARGRTGIRGDADRAGGRQCRQIRARLSPVPRQDRVCADHRDGADE